MTAINLLCQYHLSNQEPIPVTEAHKILIYTHHVKDIINKITQASGQDFPFPEFSENGPLHPILREMLTHYIGNDVYLINLIVGDFIDPVAPQSIPQQDAEKIINHTRAIKEFMDKLREATNHLESTPQPVEELPSDPQVIPKDMNKEEIFLKLRKLFAEEFKIKNEDKIKLQSRFKDDLGLDSVDTIRALILLEDGFGLEIPDEDADGVITMVQAVDYIYHRLYQKGP